MSNHQYESTEWARFIRDPPRSTNSSVINALFIKPFPNNDSSKNQDIMGWMAFLLYFSLSLSIHSGTLKPHVEAAVTLAGEGWADYFLLHGLLRLQAPGSLWYWLPLHFSPLSIAYLLSYPTFIQKTKNLCHPPALCRCPRYYSSTISLLFRVLCSCLCELWGITSWHVLLK